MIKINTNWNIDICINTAFHNFVEGNMRNVKIWITAILSTASRWWSMSSERFIGRVNAASKSSYWWSWDRRQIGAKWNSAVQWEMIPGVFLHLISDDALTMQGWGLEGWSAFDSVRYVTNVFCPSFYFFSCCQPPWWKASRLSQRTRWRRTRRRWRRRPPCFQSSTRLPLASYTPRNLGWEQNNIKIEDQTQLSLFSSQVPINRHSVPTHHTQSPHHHNLHDDPIALITKAIMGGVCGFWGGVFSMGFIYLLMVKYPTSWKILMALGHFHSCPTLGLISSTRAHSFLCHHFFLQTNRRCCRFLWNG